MNTIPEVGDVLVYLNENSDDENSWRLPEIGTVLEILETRTGQPSPYPTHLIVRNSFQSERNHYHNALIPRFFETLDNARDKVISGKKRKTTNCCWTCKHFCTPDCLARNKRVGSSNSGCGKPLSYDKGGHMMCSGSKKPQIGCGALKSPCWERFEFGARRRATPANLQRNLVFPRCPNQT